MIRQPLAADIRPCLLTDAIRPAADSGVPLYEGYRLETYRGRPGLQIPVLAAAVSRERLFDVFLQLLDPLGEIVDVVLETSHGNTADRHRDLRRTHIDRPVLESYMCEFEDLLLNDGCTGVAVVASGRPMEVQFDEHKLLICYARNLKPFRRVLKAAGIPPAGFAAHHRGRTPAPHPPRRRPPVPRSGPADRRRRVGPEGNWLIQAIVSLPAANYGAIFCHRSAETNRLK